MPHITEKDVSSILTKTGGYLRGYSHSLNPYKGCVYGCSYCYVRKSPVNLFHEGEWGTWIEVKRQATEALIKEMRRAKKKGPVTIFMSSSTDPYQPIEHREQITRSLLEVLVQPDYQPDFLLIQTRSPMVTRDLDLFKMLGRKLRVSMTIETDRDEVRKRFAPISPPIPARINALKALTEAGIPTQAAVAPLLPFSDTFPEQLRGITTRICLDDYFNGDGSLGKRTKALKIGDLYEEEERSVWYTPETLHRVRHAFETVFGGDRVFLSQEGFAPY